MNTPCPFPNNSISDIQSASSNDHTSSKLIARATVTYMLTNPTYNQTTFSANGHSELTTNTHKLENVKKTVAMATNIAMATASAQFGVMYSHGVFEETHVWVTVESSCQELAGSELRTVSSSSSCFKISAEMALHVTNACEEMKDQIETPKNEIKKDSQVFQSSPRRPSSIKTKEPIIFLSRRSSEGLELDRLSERRKINPKTCSNDKNRENITISSFDGLSSESLENEVPVRSFRLPAKRSIGRKDHENDPPLQNQKNILNGNKNEQEVSNSEKTVKNDNLKTFSHTNPSIRLKVRTCIRKGESGKETEEDRSTKLECETTLKYSDGKVEIENMVLPEGCRIYSKKEDTNEYSVNYSLNNKIINKDNSIRNIKFDQFSPMRENII